MKIASIFFLVGLVSIIFGANGIAGISLGIGKVLLYVFFGLSALSFLISFVSKRQKEISTSR